MIIAGNTQTICKGIFGAGQYASASTVAIIYGVLSDVRGSFEVQDEKSQLKGKHYRSNAFCLEKALQSILLKVGYNKRPWEKAQDIDLYVMEISLDRLLEAASCALNFAARTDFNNNKYGEGNDYFSIIRAEEKRFIMEGCTSAKASAKARRYVQEKYQRVADNGKGYSQHLAGGISA